MRYEQLSIELSLSGGVINVSDLLVPDTYNEDFSLCNDKKMSTLNSVSFTLRYDRSVAMAIIAEKAQIGVQVKEAEYNQVVFTGVLDPVADLSVMNHREVGDITLEAVDPSVSLDVPIEDDLSYPAVVGDAPLSVCNPANPSMSLLHSLLDLAGWGDRISADVPAITETVQHVAAAAEEFTYRELLDSLLYEHLHVLYCTPEGVITIIPWSHSMTAGAGVLNEDSLQVNPPLTMSRKYRTKDGVKVVYAKAAVIQDAKLWSGSLPIGGEEDPIPGEPIAAGDYWPEDSDIQEIWQDYTKEWLDVPYLEGKSRLKNDDLSLIATSSHVLEDEKDEGVVLDPVAEGLTVDFRAKRARLRYKNTAAEARKLYISRIKGTALIRETVLNCKLPETAKDPQEYTSLFIFNQLAAEALLRAIYTDYVYGDMSYTFSSRKHLELGSVWTLDHKSAEISTSVMITSRSRTRGSEDLYAYRAVGVTEVGSSAVVHKGSQASPSVVRSAPRFITQYAVDSTGPWHSTLAEGDLFMRVSSDGGLIWSNPTQIKGESLYTWIAYADNQEGSGLSSTPVDGSGNYKSFIGYAYNMATEMPETPDPSLFTWSPYVYRLIASLLQIVSGGAIYSGYSSDGTEPTSGAGFWLGSDGILKAVNGIFSGIIYALDGFFKGSFETPTIVSEAGEENSYSKSASGGQSQARTMCGHLETIGIAQGVLVKSSGSFTGKTVARIKYSYSKTNRQYTTQVYTWNGEFPIDNASNWYYVTNYHSETKARFVVNVFFSDGDMIELFTEILDTNSSSVSYPSYPSVNEWSDAPTSGSSYSETLNVTIYTGGDVLKILNLPTSETGLDVGRVYNSNGFLKVK